MNPSSAFDLLLGPSVAGRLVILTTVVVYAWLFYSRPDDARASLRSGLTTFGRLFTLIVAALMIASAIGILVAPTTIQRSVGEAAGARGAVLGGLLGGLLPGGPYATYPIIRGVQTGGAGFAATIAMLTGYGAIGLGRLPYGLVFFDTKTIGLRLVAGLVTVLAVSIGVFTLV